MPINSSIANKSRDIRLRGTADIARAAEIKEMLLDALNSSARVTIHIDESVSIDVTTVQLLHASALHAATMGAKLTLAGRASRDLLEMLSDTGLLPYVNFNWEVADDFASHE